MDGFLLARSGMVLRATGARHVYRTASDAAAALRAGEVSFVAGALPFDPEQATALFVPDRVTRSAVAIGEPAAVDLAVIGENPSPDEHVAQVSRAIELIQTGDLQKVVLARSIDVAASTPIDPLAFAAQAAARYPGGNVFAVDLSAAGPDYVGVTLIGASPEVLVSRRGAEVTLKPLAGSAPRGGDPESDEANAQKLLDSGKNQEEHGYVIEYLREKLTPLCANLAIPDQPILASTPDVWHLATPIRAHLKDVSVTALDLAMLLHPTPAVCGTPTTAALDEILRSEEDRGFYAGAVGWCDANGDGDWIVSIRCAQLSPDCRTARLYAGGGIVASSDPGDELAETTAKLRTLRGLLSADTD